MSCTCVRRRLVGMKRVQFAHSNRGASDLGAESAAAGRARYQSIGLLLGPVIAFAMLLAGAPPALEGAAWFTAAIGLLMAIWWATEAVPIAVTSFLP